MKNLGSLVLAGSLILGLSGVFPAHAAVNAAEAKSLMGANKCFRCHAPDKAKTGPSLKKIAAKYKDRTDGEEKIIKQMTTGPTVKLDDGTEEEHKMINVKDPEKLKNLAQWILSQ